MANELLRKRGDRPTHLTLDGWTVFICVRDGEYERRLRQWKSQVRAAHPDVGGSHSKFLSTYRAFRRWRMQEALWYAQFTLTPPDGWQGAAQILERRKRLRGIEE